MGTTNQGTTIGGFTINSTGNYTYNGVIGAITVAGKTGSDIRVSLTKAGSGTQTLTAPAPLAAARRSTPARWYWRTPAVRPSGPAT